MWSRACVVLAVLTLGCAVRTLGDDIGADGSDDSSDGSSSLSTSTTTGASGTGTTTATTVNPTTVDPTTESTTSTTSTTSTDVTTSATTTATASATMTTSATSASTTTGGGVCEPDPNDDECTFCVKELCCDELETCFQDESCACALLCIIEGVPFEECILECGLSPALLPVASCAGQFCGCGP